MCFLEPTAVQLLWNRTLEPIKSFLAAADFVKILFLRLPTMPVQLRATWVPMSLELLESGSVVDAQMKTMTTSLPESVGEKQCPLSRMLNS